MNKNPICSKAPSGFHTFTKTTNCDWCGRGAVIVDDKVLYCPSSEMAVDYHLRTEPNVLFWGGRGSSKSTTGRWDAHMRALAYPGFKYCILRRTYPEILKSHLIDLPREMKALGGTFHHTDKRAIYPNGSLGFFSHCYDSETEVLTERGFIKFPDLSKTDKVASLSLKLNTIEFVTPMAFQKFFYSGDMVRIKSHGVDLLVTPDHKMLFWDRYSNPVTRLAKDLFGAPRGRYPLRFGRTGVWVGKEKQWHTFREVEQPSVGRPRLVVDKVPMDEWLEWLGWFLSEGSATKCIPRKNDGFCLRYVQVAQKKYPDVISRLSQITRSWGLSPSTHIKPDGVEILKVSNIQFYDEHSIFGKCDKKFVPDYVKQLSPRQIKIFLSALFLGDGSISHGKWLSYTTTSKQLADDVQELLLKIGMIGTVTVRSMIGRSLLCYTVIITHVRKNPCFDPSYVFTEKYNGYVYDVTMPNSPTLLIRRNGRVLWGHNCSTEQDVLNLLSAEFYLMFFDEISTFEWEMFTKLAASVRVPVGSGLTAMVRAATNPLGVSAEMINRYWVAKDITLDEDPYYNPNDWYGVKANVDSNPYLDAEQYKARFSGLPEHVRKAWVDGDFQLEHALFNFQPTKSGRPYHVIHEIDLPKILKAATIYKSIDSGWHPDPTVVLWVAHLGNRHIVFHEKIWYRTAAAEIAEDIKAEDARLGITRTAMTFCDPSMDINTTADIRTVKEIYEVAGVPMENSINNREFYASAMHNALAEEAGDALPRIQFYVHGKDGCPYLVRTIPQMRYNPKRPKAMDDHKQDHAVVACCYYLMSHSADLRNEIQFGKTVPKWMRPRKEDRFVLGRESVREKR